MLTLPNLPTESLNKFLALGGILAILATAILYISELKKIEVDNIKLSTNYDLYNLRLKLYGKDLDRYREEFKEDSGIAQREIQRAIKLEALEKKQGGAQIIIYHNRQYSTTDYHAFMANKYDEAVSKLNEQFKTRIKANEADDATLIRLKEQAALIRANSRYILLIKKISYLIVGASFLISVYGFKQWHRVQEVSDNLVRVQLARSEKELDDLKNKDSEKKKLIL